MTLMLALLTIVTSVAGCIWWVTLAADRLLWPWAARRHFDARLTREENGIWYARDRDRDWIWGAAASPKEALKLLIEVRYEVRTTTPLDLKETP